MYVHQTVLYVHVQVNLRDTDGNTALHKAAESNQPSACRFLIANGADPSIKNCNDRTPADLATDAVAKVITEEPVKASTDIESQLLEAAKNGDLDTVKVHWLVELCSSLVLHIYIYVQLYVVCVHLSRERETMAGKERGREREGDRFDSCILYWCSFIYSLPYMQVLLAVASFACRICVPHKTSTLAMSVVVSPLRCTLLLDSIESVQWSIFSRMVLMSMPETKGEF